MLPTFDLKIGRLDNTPANQQISSSSVLHSNSSDQHSHQSLTLQTNLPGLSRQLNTTNNQCSPQRSQLHFIQPSNQPLHNLHRQTTDPSQRASGGKQFLKISCLLFYHPTSNQVACTHVKTYWDCLPIK